MQIIYISGIDGCGKTTQSEQLVEKLRQKGISAEYQWLRWEPSIVSGLKLIKKMLGKNSRSSNKDINTNEKADSKWSDIKGKLMSSALFRKLWLSYASRDYHRAFKRAIRQWNADVLIMDRYIFDFLVDQSLNFGLTIEEAEKLFDNTAISRMHKPDLNIIIDISAETGFKRKMDGTSINYLKDRSDIYKGFTGDNVHHIDGMLGIDEIQQHITEWVNDKTGLLR